MPLFVVEKKKEKFMTKATTPFKMFYVNLPTAKPFSAKRVRCYLDLETGNIFGSKEVVSRFLKLNEEISNSVDAVLYQAQQLMNYYWTRNGSIDKGIAPTVMIRGQVVKRLNPNSNIPYSKFYGKNSKIEFVLL